MRLHQPAVEVGNVEVMTGGLVLGEGLVTEAAETAAPEPGA